jgi:3-hydroxyisobutyrate dehydrogenase-like beta-hydroxyacid dehydrogenase
MLSPMIDPGRAPGGTSDRSSQTIALIGLGQMGLAMAGNLLGAGYRLRVWNRTPDKAGPLIERGAAGAASPAEAVGEGASIVITILTDDAALHEVVHGADGFAAALRPSMVHVSMSTIAPVTAEALAADHVGRGAGFVAAPVFGKPDAAAAARLVICVSGAPDAKAQVAPMLSVLGHRIADFGENPAAAPTIKLAGNFMIGAAIEAMGEAFTLAEKTGVPRQLVHELFSSTMFACPIYQNYGKMIASRHYQPAGAPPALIRKDMRLVLEHAGRQLVPMPLASLVHDRLTAAVAKGVTGVDWTAFVEGVSIAAGLEVPNNAARERTVIGENQ